MSEQRNAARANILAGPEVGLIEISRRELLIECDVRLAPGAGICLNVAIGDANYLAGGRVTRVDAALTGGQVRYRAGVKLDNEIPAFDRAAVPEIAPHAPVPHTTPQPDSPPGAAEEPMDSQQTLQMLKTALRSSEAVRKELTDQHEAERAGWDAERRALEAKVAHAEKTATSAGQHVTAAREAEKLLAGKHVQEQTVWAKERAALQESAKQAAARGQQAEARVKEHEARLSEAETRLKEHEARVREAEAKGKEHEARARDAEAKGKQIEGRAQQAETHAKDLESRVKELDSRLKDLEPRLKAAESRATQADTAAKQNATRADQLQQQVKGAQDKELAAAARVKEVESAHRALQEAFKKAEASAHQAAHDVAALKENEQRLVKRAEEQTRKIDVLLKERERLDAELEGALATVAAAEQRVATQEKERRDWAAQKERLTARLQTTEKWCADQQQLLYELQQHLGRAATLLDGWTPPHDVANDAGGPAETKTVRKATA